MVVIVRPVLCKPFVGRLEELAYLRERRLEAGASHGGLVLVAGEAGVGKSRLLAEFRASLAYSKWRVGVGSCLEFGSRPYGPLLDVLARIGGEPFDLVAANSKAEQFETIVARIVTLAAKTGLVIAIEDVHWADAATLDLLAYLGTKLGRMRVLVVATYRTHDLPLDHPAVVAIEKIARGSHAGRIELAPLRGPELETFIDEALGERSLSGETRRAIAHAGDGNPFFTEELLKSAVECDARQGDRTSAHRDLPPTVRATLLERLRPFDENERRVVSQAAVIGRTFRLPLLATTLATDVEGLLPTLRRARDFQLIEEVTPTTFRFRHGLTREAIYGDFLGAEVRPRHRAIAVALESATLEERSLEALAYHWWAAGEDGRCIRYNEEAGDAATAVHAHEDALAFYERALDVGEISSLALGNLHEKIAESHIALAATAAARASFERAADAFAAVGAHDREATARVVAAQTAYVLGLPRPTAALEAMLARLDASAYLAVSRVALGIAWIDASFWYPARAATYLERVDARALAAHADIRLRYHNVAAWIAMNVGDLARFRSEHVLWIVAARDTGSHRALAGAHYNGAMCLGFFGVFEDALAELDRAFAVVRESRQRLGEGSAHVTAVMIHLFRGDLARARSEAVALARTAPEILSPWSLLVAVTLDDRELIATYLETRETEQLRSPDFDTAAAFAELFVRRGRHRDATTILDRAKTEGDVIRGSFYTLLAMGAYGSPATRARARTLLARAAEGVTPSPETYALALFDARVAREEGRANDAYVLARSAAEGFRTLRFPLLEAQALEVTGDFDEARALYARCGAAYDARRLGAFVPPDSATREKAAIAATLSPREREIATLAARGRSNVEIARELSITHKTVEKHLGSAYQKLGVTSRNDLHTVI